MNDSSQTEFKTNSGLDIEELYTPEHIIGFDSGIDLGVPGEFPFTRGPYQGMYRTRVWTRRPATLGGRLPVPGSRLAVGELVA